MIISRTPFRVSLFGGGSDYPPWVSQHGGAVLGFAIDKYCYITLRTLPPFFDHKHRIVWSKIELPMSYAEIEHPAIKAVLQEHPLPNGLELHHDGDLPARSGMGSSSSFCVGLLNALYAARGYMVPAAKLASEATRIEQDVLSETVGFQDQVWAAHGGFNRIDFHKSGCVEVTPIISDKKQQLQDSLLLVYTGVSRFSSEIAVKQVANFSKREKHLLSLRTMVDDAMAVLTDPAKDLNDLGCLLHASWDLKRHLADGVATDLVDEIYQEAMDAGATGGKLLGAGGGGFMLFFCPNGALRKVKQRLRRLVQVNFTIGAPGSKIVLYEPNGFADGVAR